MDSIKILRIFLFSICTIFFLFLTAKGFPSHEQVLRMYGESSNDQMGKALSGIDDLSGDSVPDILVSLHRADVNEHMDAGKVLLISGGELEILATFKGKASGDLLGWSISRCGDLNGDSVPEILIGAAFADGVGYVDSGIVYVFSGKDKGSLRQFYGELDGDFLGGSLSSIDDLDGDGIEEIVIGAYGSDLGDQADCGIVYVYSGSSGILLHKIEGEAEGDFFGWSVAGISDLNEDGFPDLLVGARLADPGGITNRGSVYIISGANSDIIYRLDGESGMDNFGWAVSGIEDIDGDQVMDLIIGVPYADPSSKIDAGSVYLYSGKTGGLIQRLDGEAVGDGFGWSVAQIEDLDGDNIPEIMIGAPYTDLDVDKDVGIVSIFSGANGGLFEEYTGEQAYENFGMAVASVGDVDGDQIPDFAVGAPNAESEAGITTGAVDIFVSCTDFDGDGFTHIICGGGDCDNQEPEAFPGNPEVCGDGIDNDCDGIVDNNCNEEVDEFTPGCGCAILTKMEKNNPSQLYEIFYIFPYIVIIAFGIKILRLFYFFLPFNREKNSLF